MARRKHYNYYDDQFKATAVALTRACYHVLTGPNITGAKAPL
jgi:hypothetical protein